MSFKRNIFFAGFLLFLHCLTGCSNIRIEGIRPFTKRLDMDKVFVDRLSVRGVGNSSLTTGISFIPFLPAFIHIKVPLTKDLVKSPVIEIHNEGKVVQVKEPFSGSGFYAKWDSNAIGDIAQRYGMKEVYFADMEIFSVLGIWTHRKVYVYGE